MSNGAERMTTDAMPGRVEAWVCGSLDAQGTGSRGIAGYAERLARSGKARATGGLPGPGNTPKFKPNDPSKGWQQLRVSDKGGVAIARLRRKSILTEAEVRAVATELSDLIAAGYPRVAVDFADVERLSCSIGPALEVAAERCKALAGKLKLVGLRPELVPAVALAKSAEVLADEAAALGSPWPCAAPQLPTAVIQAFVTTCRATKDAQAALVPDPADDASDRLRVVAADGRSMKITKAGLIFGREQGCSIRLGSAQVSRHHAELKRSGGSYWLRDLGSTNGTARNGQLIGTETVEVFEGDEIGIGEFRFQLGARRPIAIMPEGPSDEQLLDWLGAAELDQVDPQADTSVDLQASTAAVRSEVVGDVLVVVPLVTELVEGSAVAELGEELRTLLGRPGPRRVVIDLGHVASLGAPAVGLLAALEFQLDRAGGALRLCRPNPRVALGLDHVQLGLLMGIYAELDEAVLSPWDQEIRSPLGERPALAV